MSAPSGRPRLVGCASLVWGPCLLACGGLTIGVFGWEAAWWVVPLAGPVALVGLLLLLEVFFVRRGPAKPARCGRFWPLPIRLLQGAGRVFLIGTVFGGALVGFTLYGLILQGTTALLGLGPGMGPWASVCAQVYILFVALTCVLGGAFLVPRLAAGLIERNVPGRCPRCGGPAYFHSPGEFHCRSCGHVQEVAGRKKEPAPAPHPGEDSEAIDYQI